MQQAAVEFAVLPGQTDKAAFRVELNLNAVDAQIYCFIIVGPDGRLCRS